MSRLLYERLARGLTQTQLGFLARIPQPVISQIETRRLTPTDPQRLRLAAVFNLKPEELLADVTDEQVARDRQVAAAYHREQLETVR